MHRSGVLAFALSVLAITLVSAQDRTSREGCASAPGAADEAAVRAVAAGIVEADNARDLERVLGLYAADATLWPPGEPMVVGRDRIRPRYETLFAGFEPAIELRLDSICVSGALATVRGHNGGRMKSRTGTPDRVLDDNFLMLLTREAAGRWRIQHLVWR